MKINTAQFAYLLAYAVWHRATDSDWVAEQILAALDAHSFESSEQLDPDLERATLLLKKEWQSGPVTRQIDAARALIIRAIENYKPTDLDRREFELLSTLSIEDYLAQDREGYLAEYRAKGLRRIDPPRVLVVDNYPPPYQHLTGNALAPDRTDRERYGFENAIYFRRAKFTPVISSLILAHELAHTFIADDCELARGLEEGLADFWAHCVIAPFRLGRNPILNHFSTRRISYGRTQQRFHVYADNFRRVHWLYGQFGLSPLVNMMRVGRREIKRVEIALSDPVKRKSALRRPWLLNRAIHEDIADELSLLAMENETYSPLALLYCMQQTGETQSTISPDLRDVVLKELEKRTFAVVLGDRGNVEFQDYRGVAQCSWARFDPHG